MKLVNSMMTTTAKYWKLVTLGRERKIRGKISRRKVITMSHV